MTKSRESWLLLLNFSATYIYGPTKAKLDVSLFSSGGKRNCWVQKKKQQRAAKTKSFFSAWLFSTKEDDCLYLCLPRIRHVWQRPVSPRHHLAPLISLATAEFNARLSFSPPPVDKRTPIHRYPSPMVYTMSKHHLDFLMQKTSSTHLHYRRFGMLYFRWTTTRCYRSIEPEGFPAEFYQKFWDIIEIFWRCSTTYIMEIHPF